MKNTRKGFTFLPVILIIVAVLVVGGVYYYTHQSASENDEQSDDTVDADALKTYHNTEYGFEMTFPDSWKGHSVEKNTWNGRGISDTNTQEGYTGPLLIMKNPQTTSEQAWHDIPIMVFTPDVWKLVADEKIAVSAAPIGPTKIGENSDYVFATPPRWYGFTDTQGWEEAVEIVKTFRATAVGGI